MKGYREIKRISAQNEKQEEKGPAARKGKNSATFMVGDTAHVEMPYTQEAAIKAHSKRLKQFIKYIDYIIIDSKVQMVVNTTKHIAKRVQYFNKVQLQPNSIVFGNNNSTWFVRLTNKNKKNKN